MSWLGNWKQLCDVARMELATVFLLFRFLCVCVFFFLWESPAATVIFPLFVVSSLGACGNWNVKCALPCVLRHCCFPRFFSFYQLFPPSQPVSLKTGLNGAGADLSAAHQPELPLMGLIVGNERTASPEVTESDSFKGWDHQSCSLCKLY